MRAKKNAKSLFSPELALVSGIELAVGTHATPSNVIFEDLDSTIRR